MSGLEITYVVMALIVIGAVLFDLLTNNEQTHDTERTKPVFGEFAGIDLDYDKIEPIVGEGYLLHMERCPHCGSDPNTDYYDACYPLTRDRTEWTAGCPWCLHNDKTYDTYVLGTSEEDAINNWNEMVNENIKTTDQP